jgi:hypothetical protein
VLATTLAISPSDFLKEGTGPREEPKTLAGKFVLPVTEGSIALRDLSSLDEELRSVAISRLHFFGTTVLRDEDFDGYK